MEGFYSKSQYKSVDFILNSYSSEIFDGITVLMRPVVGGMDYLRSVHQAYKFQKEITKISEWSPETREILLNALTDVVSGKTINESIIPELEAKLSELDEINETLNRISQVSKTLNQHNLVTILTLSLNKFKGKITSIRSEINLKMWDKNENVNELLVLDQSFYLIQDLIDQSLKVVSSSKISDYGELWKKIIFSILYIEAFHRGKVTFEELQDYISELNLYCYKEEYILKKHDAVFEVLA